ncbi:hypothetical protein [Rhodanobacter sp. OK091]|uniref:hypothetical protein n=1 Tax=Rhodanobacter sp. OK091 TaxID=1881037 RepID=UPI00091E4CB9|nr:hypothetical protein [Rhodanobacter sp. OK091]SHM11814.1 hypothetical protein SAMN05428972_2398 [Rhodanobacter sp. OK091]
MIRSRKNACLLTVFALWALALSGCRHMPDEQQVRESIAAVAQAAEAGAASDVSTPLSNDFDGNAGELDRRELTNMVRLLALRGEHIGVTMGPVSIEHRGERMVATFTVTLTSGGKLLPDQLGLYEVESAWRKDDGKWRCYTASWKHAM